MDFWELTNKQLVETLHKLDLKKGGNVPEKMEKRTPNFLSKSSLVALPIDKTSQRWNWNIGRTFD